SPMPLSAPGNWLPVSVLFPPPHAATSPTTPRTIDSTGVRVLPRRIASICSLRKAPQRMEAHVNGTPSSGCAVARKAAIYGGAHQRHRERVGTEDDLFARAEKWASEDPDPDAQREIRDLVKRGARAELLDRFAGALEFGTAGLRGILGAGPNRMNRAVVART